MSRSSDLKAPLMQVATPVALPPAESPTVARAKALLYGLINTIVVAPVMIGFAAIIFRHEAFHEDPAVYSRLVKLVVFSSAVHQAAFTYTSSLPFAIGQVQDAGLIFLSKMACEVRPPIHAHPRARIPDAQRTFITPMRHVRRLPMRWPTSRAST